MGVFGKKARYSDIYELTGYSMLERRIEALEKRDERCFFLTMIIEMKKSSPIVIEVGKRTGEGCVSFKQHIYGQWKTESMLLLGTHIIHREDIKMIRFEEKLVNGCSCCKTSDAD